MRHFSSALLIGLVSVSSCEYEPQVAPPFDARLHQPMGAELEVRYTIAYLPTLNGSRNRPSGIASNGLIAGFVNRPGNATRVVGRAVLHGTTRQVPFVATPR